MVGDSFLGIHVFYPFQKIVVVLIQYTSYQHLEKPVHSPHNASHLESHFDVVTSHEKISECPLLAQYYDRAS